MPMSLDDVRALSFSGMPIQEGIDYHIRSKHDESYTRMDYTLFVVQLASLKPEQITALLKKSSELAWHPLMTVSRYYPDCLPGLFDALYSISQYDRTAIFQQLNHREETALDLTMRFHPKTINHWIDAAIKYNDLSLFTRAPNAFKCIARHHPTAFKILLPMLAKLDFKTQLHLFSGKTPLNFAKQYVKSLNKDHEARAAFAHAQTQFFLQKIKMKIADLDSRVGFSEDLDAQQAKEALTTLYTTLQESYDTYLALHMQTTSYPPQPSAPPLQNPAPPYVTAPPPPPMTLERLKETWASAIKAAAPVLSKHRGCKEALFRTGMVGLSLITFGGPIWYSLSNHASFFPPSPDTDSMHIVHEVEGAFEKELQFKTL